MKTILFIVSMTLFMGVYAFSQCTYTVSTYPYSEGFESGFGYWTQSTADDFDWTQQSGGTSSTSTGPSGAYEGTYYIYTESSSPNYPSKIAIIEGPCLDLVGYGTAQFDFYYHMYGATMGTLEFQVETTPGSGSWLTVWSMTGDQGNQWFLASVDLSTYVGDTIRVRFKGTVGSSYTSDMCVDDINVNAYPMIANDAGLISIDNPPASPVPSAVGVNNVDVTIKNFGSSNLTSCNINYDVDGTPQISYNWSGNLVSNATDGPLTIGTANLTYGSHTIKVWTDSPNGVSDNNNYNDTLSVDVFACNILNGTYTVGGASPDYTTIGDALTALENCGVNGQVTFNIRPGTYYEQLIIPEIAGASDMNTITFQSETGDSTDVIIDWPSSSSSIDNFAVELNGADYIVLKHLTIQRSGTNSYANVVALENGATHNVITNCRIIGLDINNSSINYTLIYSSSSGEEDSTIITYNNLLYGSNAIYFDGSSSVPESKILIKGNKINGFSYYGIRLEYATAPVIAENDIDANSTNAYSTQYGIYMYYASDSLKITKNKIATYGTTSNYGIEIYYCNATGTEALVSNNFYTQITGTGTVYGLYIYNSNYVRVYHNSVHITAGSSTSTGAYLYCSSGSYGNIAFQNNNIVNDGGGYAIYFSSSAVTYGYVTKCDYNNYYTTGSVLGNYGGTTCADLATWQSTSTFDYNTVNINPVFTGINDLHTFSIGLNALGTPILAVTEDIDGEPRDPSTPDIGADEFTPAADDAGILSIDNPTTPALPGINNIEITIRNYGLNDLTTCDIDWELNGISQSTYNWSGTLATATNDGPILIGTGTFNYGHNTLKVWTTNPNGTTDGNQTNDTLEIDIYACDPLNGTYSLGAVSSDFPTFDDAINAMQTCNISGPVVFNIEPGTYSEQIILPEIATASATNTITFQSSTGNNTDVVIDWPTSTTSTNNYTLLFDGADYIIFKDVTLKRTGYDTYGEVVVFDNEATNNQILDNIIVGSSIAGSSSTYASVIYSNTDNDSDNKIIGNDISQGSSAFYLDGSSSSPEHGWVIQNNNVHDFSYYGVRLEYSSGNIIRNNSFVGSSTLSYTYNYGIYLYYCDSSQLIDKNIIELWGTTYNYGIYHYYCDGVFGQQALITNNFISKLSNTTNTTYGIYSYNSNYGKIYNNSVHITTSSTTSGIGIYMNSSSSGSYGNLAVQNNNIVNSGGGYAMEISSGASTLGYVTNSDYNNFYSTGTSVGNYGGTDCADLSAWQTASSLDNNSVSVDPGFSSASDLHVFSIALDGLGNSVPEVTDDIDGDPRDPLTPDIGADEFTPAATDIGAYELIAPQSGLCYSAAETIIVSIYNYGTAAIDFSVNPCAIDVTTTGANPVVFPTVNITTGALSSGDTMQIVVTTTYDMSIPGTYYFDATATVTGDGNAINDVMPQSTIDVYSTLTAPATENFETFTTGSPGTFANGWTTESTGSFMWYVNSGSTPSTATGPAIDHTLGTSSGIYVYTEASNGSSGDEAYLISPCLDISALVAPQVSFWYHMYGAYINQLSVDVLDGDTWYEAFSLAGQQQASQNDPWEKATVSLGIYSSPERIRFRVIRGSSYEGDVSIDDINLEEAPDFDMTITSIVNPATGCDMTSAENISIEVYNTGTVAQDTIPVIYSTDGGTTLVGPEYIYPSIAPGSSVVYTFAQQADLSTIGTTYNLVAYFDTTDANNSNDTVRKNILSSPVISSYPYYQDFEGTQYWIAQGVNSSWQLGTPAGTTIIGAASGINAWMTGLSADYLSNDNSWVVGPCFDFSSLVQPIIEMDIWVNSESDYDGAALQYSLDEGSTWTTIGNYNDPVNWYNDNSINGLGYSNSNIGWSGTSSTGWIHVKHDLTGLGGLSDVKLRIAFGSDGSSVYDGFAFDNVLIYETPNKDLSVTDWLAPVDDCILTPNESVTITIENYGLNSQSNFPVSYSLDGGTTWIPNETVAATINPGASYDYTFTTPADFSNVGTYECKAAIMDPTDEMHQNDTLQKTVEISGIQNFPYVEDFETATTGTPGVLPAAWSTSSNTSYVWYVNNGSTPTAMTGPSKDHTTGITGGHYVYTEGNNGTAGDTAFLYLPCADMSNYTTPALMFWYHMYGSDIDTLYIDVNVGGWINDIYHIGGEQDTSSTDPWQKATVDLTPYVNATEIRFRAIKGNGNLGDIAIDDIQILEPSYDIGVVSINNPLSSCSLGPYMAINVTVENFGTLEYNAGDTIVMTHVFQGGSPVVKNLILTSVFSPGASLSYTFPGVYYDMTAVGSYDIIVYTSDPNDVDNTNDTSSVIVYNYGNPTLSLGSDIITTQPDTVVIDAGSGWSSYMWFDMTTTQTYNVDTAGYYWVEVTDTNGCSAVDTIYVGSAVATDQLNAEMSYSVYPNPNKGLFSLQINLTEAQTVWVELIDVKGKKIMVNELKFSDSYIKDFDIRHLSSGVYYLNIKTEKNVAVEKIILR